MVIDIHTHAFPEAIAHKAIAALQENINNVYTPVHDGTLSGLIKNMDDWGIDVSVVQPVLTKPSQMRTINERARSICSDRILSFGAIDPHADDYKEAIDFVASLGLKGIKFHPEYQNFTVDEPRMLRVYDYALSQGLIILFHAGADPGFSAPFRSSPEQFARIADAMQGGVLIMAHLGGHGQWDDVERYLVGKAVYLDTSMGFEYYSPEQFMRIVSAHGSERILFGSDAPWSNASTEMRHLRALPLANSDLENILSENALRILRI